MYKGVALITIFLLFAFVRFYKLGSVPSGVYVDEAVAGYNAWSMASTGADEYGMKWPVFLRSFGTFPGSLYAHLSSILVKFIGLDNFSTRLLSAFSGLGLIVAIYLIFRELKFSYVEKFVAVSLAGLSPWMILMSRTGTEGHLSLLLATLAVLFALRSKRSNYYWILFFFFLGLASYAYQGARPIALGYLVFFSWWRRKEIGRNWVLGLVIFALTLLPQLKIMNTPAFSQRGTGLFYWEAAKRNSFIYEFMSQATSYFSPYSIFWKGDDDLQRSLPGISNFAAIFGILYLVGWGGLLKKFKSDQGRVFLILAITGTIVPAMTKDPFSATRGQFLILPIVMLMVWGFTSLRQWVGQRKMVFIFILMNIWGMIWLWRSLFVLLPYERGYIWGYGIKELAMEIKSRQDEKFVVEQSRQSPIYIQLLYELRYPPTSYQATQTRSGYYTDTNYNLGREFGNVKIKDIEWKKDIYLNQILVGDELSISEDQAREHFLDKVFEIRDPVGKILFAGYRTNPSKKKISEEILLLKKTN